MASYSVVPRSVAKPRDRVALDCGSQSTMRVRLPSAARLAPRLTAVVVLPTPPFLVDNGQHVPHAHLRRESIAAAPGQRKKPSRGADTRCLCAACASRYTASLPVATPGNELNRRLSMKAICQQEQLARGLAIVGRAVPTRSTLPVLANVLIATDDTALRLSATNLEVGITCTVPAQHRTTRGPSPFRPAARGLRPVPARQRRLHDHWTRTRRRCRSRPTVSKRR